METAPNCKSTSAGACNKEKALSGHCEIVTVPLTALIWTPELGLADADCCDQVRVMVMVTRCHSFSAASVTPRHVSRVACRVSRAMGHSHDTTPAATQTALTSDIIITYNNSGAHTAHN